MSDFDEQPVGRRGVPGEGLRVRLVRWLLYLACAAVLAATLFPTEPWEDLNEFGACIVCGQRGWADVVVNVILFTPLGAAIALGGGALPRALLMGAALSMSVEGAQLFIPGRDASYGDLIFNTLGVMVGVLAVRSLPVWAHLSDRAAARLSILTAVAAAAVIAATGWLLQPEPPLARYFAQWTPELSHLDRFEGRVESVRLGPLSLLPGEIEEPARVAELLRNRAPLVIHGEGGGPVDRLAAIFAIYDNRRREVILIGPDRDELVVRFRTRAAGLRLDQPDLRLADGASFRNGEAFSLRVDREGDGYCVDTGEVRRCGVGYRTGIGWGILFYVEHWAGWMRALLGALWMAALLFPTGFLLRKRWESVAAIGILIPALLVLPPAVGLLPLTPLEAAGAAAGALAGAAAARMIRRGQSLSQPAAGTDPRTAAS